MALHAPYGSHLLVTLVGSPTKLLHDLKVIYNLLDRLPGLIGMEKIGPPQVVKFDEQDKAGITGFVLITTSHISFHGYSLDQRGYLDVFACKVFEPEIVLEVLANTLRPQLMEVVVLERGETSRVISIYAQHSAHP